MKEITKAEDMKGLSIRVQESPIWFALADHLDFIATPISFNELYTALQQGTVDGQENPIASISSMNIILGASFLAFSNNVLTLFIVCF